MYHGIATLLHPEELIFRPEVFIILVISFVVEFVTLSVAFRELWKGRVGGATLSDALREGDPTVLAVVYEDSVAVFGVFVAAVSIWLSYITGNPAWDSGGSIVIGLLLAWFAVVLILKQAFLVEKSIPEEVKERIIEMLLADPMIERVRFQVVSGGWVEYRAKCEVEVNGTALFRSFNGVMLKDDYETVKRIIRSLCVFVWNLPIVCHV